MDNDSTKKLQTNSSDEHPFRVSVTVLESEPDGRTHLSSSDTVILDTSSINTANTLPGSTSLLIPNYSILEKILSTDKSPVYTINKPFSLLTNISDRSVSLESIPSLGLFQPDHESISNVSLNKTVTAGISSDSTKDTSEAIIVDTACSSDSSEMAVVGSSKVPHSILLLVKPELNNASPAGNKQICLTTPPERNKDNSSILHTTSNKARKDCNFNSSLSGRREIDAADEDHSDTDTEMQDEAVSMANFTENNLSRSDTVVLNENRDSSLISSNLRLLSSDTINLTCDNDQEVQSEDKLSEGFSFASTNSSLSTFIEAQINDPIGNKNVPVKMINSSLIKQSSIPFHIQSFKNGHSGKSLYVLTGDGHLAAVRYISNDPLDPTQLSHLRLLNSVDVIPPPVLLHNSSDAPTKSVETKETQTDLMFGTNALHFKLSDSMCGSGVYSIDQHSGEVFMDVLTTQQSPIPTIAVSEDSRASEQPQLSLEPFHETATLLAGPKTSEKRILRSSQTVHKRSERYLTQQQITGSGSSKDDCAFLNCMECQEKFRTKHDLVNHVKIHRNGFKCDLCNATFTRIGNFNRHRKIHSLQAENQNAFKCDDCGREFIQRCDLKRHQLIHTKQEPYRCEQCGKGYIRRSDLVVHMRFHNKDKAFLCSTCGKKFFQTGDLSRHIRQAHMPNSQLTCGHCNRKYASESTLIRHMKEVHKDVILCTVQQTLQNADSSDKRPPVNAKDVLFPVTQ